MAGKNRADKECRKYLRELRLAFPVFRRAERRFYKDFGNDIAEYQNRVPNSTRENLENKFGLPKEVVVEYFNNMGAGAYMKLMRQTMYLKFLILIVVAFLSASFIYQAVSIHQMREEVRNTMIVSEDAEIVEIIRFEETGEADYSK